MVRKLLAGDIGRLANYENYQMFLQTQASRFEGVFLVLRNHEFYGLTYNDVLDTARRLTDQPALDQRLVLLDKTRWDSPRSNPSILGCTLCSFIPHEKIGIVQSRVKDFKRIGDWTPATHNSVHAQEAAWLRKEVTNLTAAATQKTRTYLSLQTMHHAMRELRSLSTHIAHGPRRLPPRCWHPGTGALSKPGYLATRIIQRMRCAKTSELLQISAVMSCHCIRIATRTITAPATTLMLPKWLPIKVGKLEWLPWIKELRTNALK